MWIFVAAFLPRLFLLTRTILGIHASATLIGSTDITASSKRGRIPQRFFEVGNRVTPYARVFRGLSFVYFRGGVLYDHIFSRPSGRRHCIVPLRYRVQLQRVKESGAGPHVQQSLPLQPLKIPDVETSTSGPQTSTTNAAVPATLPPSSDVIVVPTADAQTQARLPADPEATARAAVAVAALAQGTQPPILPRELARLDRVDWVLRHTKLGEVSGRLNKTEEALRRARARGRESDDEDDDDGDVDHINGEYNETTDGKTGGGGNVEGDQIAPGEVSSRGQGKRDYSRGRLADGYSSSIAHTPEHEYPYGNVLLRVGQTQNSGSTPLMATNYSSMTSPDGMSISPYRKLQIDRRQEQEDSQKQGNQQDNEVVTRLAALFEFLRFGNPSLLPPDLRDEWDARPDLGLGLLPQERYRSESDFNYAAYPSRTTSTRRVEHMGIKGTIDDSSSPVETRTVYSSAVTSEVSAVENSPPWKELCREARPGGGRPMTFHDLRIALTARSRPGRRTETTDAKMERRLVEERHRVDEMTIAIRGNDRALLGENPYAKSAEIQTKR